MRPIISIAIIIPVLLTIGCVTKAPPTHYYVLSQAKNIAEQQDKYDLVVGIGRLGMASHLSKSGIVVEKSEQEINAAHFHRWAEDPEIGIARTLQSDLSKAITNVRFDNGYSAILPDWQYRIHVQVDQFNGSKDGEAVFSGYWRLEDIGGSQIIAARQFLIQQPMNGQGYEKLVLALRQCVGLLAQELGYQIQASVMSK